MTNEGLPKLDPLIHAPIRLAILTVLSTAPSADFNQLKQCTGASDGNLSTHLLKLEQGGLIDVEKRFSGKKPQTLCRISQKGRHDLSQYLKELQKLLAPLATIE